MGKITLVTVFLMFVCLLTPLLADEITITYSPTSIGNESRYWRGQGILSCLEPGKNFSLNVGDARIISFSSSFFPFKKEEKRIYFANPRNENFEALFLTPKPTGHGLYAISLDLPEITPQKKVKIRIEKAEKVVFPNLPFASNKEGDYLVLETTTIKRHLRFRYLTKLAYMLFADTLGAGVFTLVLLGYVALKRKSIKEIIRSRMGKTKLKSPFGFKRYSNYYEISFEPGAWKKHKAPVKYQGGKLRVRIPFWFLSILLIVFLVVVFFFSVTNPLRRVWGMVGSFQGVIIFFAIVLGILATLLLISAKTDKELAFRFSVIGAGIIGSIFGYLGIFALVLAITTCFLIYFLSMLILVG
jgi:hypothetical protein